MTVRSRAAKKSRRAQKSTLITEGSTDASRDEARRSSIETWVLGLQLRALHLENAHGTDSDAGQYAFGVAVACRQAIRDQHVMTSSHLAEDLKTPDAEFGYHDASALITSARNRGEAPAGDYDQLLRGLASRTS